MAGDAPSAIYQPVETEYSPFYASGHPKLPAPLVNGYPEPPARPAPLTINSAGPPVLPTTIGHPELPATANSDVGKRPRSASTENVGIKDIKKAKTKGRDKENKPPTKANSKKVQAAAAAKAASAAAKAITAATALENDEIMGSSRWSDAEKTRLFEWILGADSDEQDERFEKHKKNPGRIYSKAILFQFLILCVLTCSVGCENVVP
jgi:hypothetical protein